MEKAFKMMDQDFNGVISKKDLKGFLKTVLFIDEKQITDLRLVRLYKLLDFHNRKSIQLVDLKHTIKMFKLPKMASALIDLNE